MEIMFTIMGKLTDYKHYIVRNVILLLYRMSFTGNYWRFIEMIKRKSCL